MKKWLKRLNSTPFGFMPAGPRLTATYLASVGFMPAGPRLTATGAKARPSVAANFCLRRDKPDGRLTRNV